nr:hypothetical protein [Sodalis-like endosymbiont of Proechinophthirus fluctus]
MFIDKYFEEFVLEDTRTTTGHTITENDIALHTGQTQTGDFYSHNNVRISEKKDHPCKSGYGLVTEQFEVLNQRGVCVLTTQHILLVEKMQPHISIPIHYFFNENKIAYRIVLNETGLVWS